MFGIIEGQTYIKKEKERSKLLMCGGAWSVNMPEIYGKPINRIQYITEKQEYSITYEDAIKHGFIRILGGEKKLIVPIKNWKVTNREVTHDN